MDDDRHVPAIVPEIIEERDSEHSGAEYTEDGIQQEPSEVGPNIYRRHLSVGDVMTRQLSSPAMDRYYSEIQLGEFGHGHDAATASRHAHTMEAGMRGAVPSNQAQIERLLRNAKREQDPAEMSRHASAMYMPRTSSMMMARQSSMGLGDHHASFLGMRNPSSIQIDITDEGFIIEKQPSPSPSQVKDKSLSLERQLYLKYRSRFKPYSKNFMKGAKRWYKIFIICCLILNPIIFAISEVAAGWLLLIEFITTLAMAMQNYPLEPGGLLAFEALAIGMTTTETVMHEIEKSLDVILLLIFMVAATHFLKRMLLFSFATIVLSIKNKTLLCLAFSSAIGLMSAFLDALTVAAVMISVTLGYISIYNEFREAQLQEQETGKENENGVNGAEQVRFRHSGDGEEKELTSDDNVNDPFKSEREQFYAFLRDLLIHGIMATAYGGAITSVGEPQNLVVAGLAGWDFSEFFYRSVAVTLPVVGSSFLTLIFLEKTKLFGFGNTLPPTVAEILIDYKAEQKKKMTDSDRAQLNVQVAVSIFIVIALALQIAPVGIVGLAAIVLVTTFNGYTEEHDLGKAFQDSMPFLSLLIVFFTIVAVIDTWDLFDPILNWILGLDNLNSQIAAMFFINGLLSMVSDNVFVATVFSNSLTLEYCAGHLTRKRYDLLSISVLSGVNILGVGTPNGSASFLFLLTSHLAPIVGLSYYRMFYMCLPYTLMMTVTGLILNLYAIPVSHDQFEGSGLISEHLTDNFCGVFGDLDH